MEKSFQFFKDQLQSIRHGFISAGLIDTIRVPYQGQKVPISQIAYSTSKNNQILIIPHDQSLIGAIVDSLKSIGFNAYRFSKTSIIVSCPRPNGEQTEKIISQIKRLAEEARIAIRGIRKNTRQRSKDFDKQLQDLTDNFIEKINLLMQVKIDML